MDYLTTILYYETYLHIKENKCLDGYPLITYQELKEKAATYAIFEFKKLKDTTNTLVWSYVDETSLYNDLYKKFLSGFKKFCPRHLFVRIDKDLIDSNLYLIYKDEYKNSL